MALSGSLQPVANERRGASRRPIAARTGLAHGDDAIDVTVLDLSESGFRATSPHELEVGGWASLSLGDMISPEAEIKWRRGDEYGFSFAFPLNAEFVAAALSGLVVELPDVDETPEAVFPAPEEPPAFDPAKVRMSWDDYRAHRCRIGEETVSLSPLMTEAVSVLLVRRGEILSGAELARAVWPEGAITRGRMATLHVTVCNLRGRLPGIILSPSRGNYMIPIS